MCAKVLPFWVFMECAVRTGNAVDEKQRKQAPVRGRWGTSWVDDCEAEIFWIERGAHMILRCRQIPKLSCRTIAKTAAVAIFPPPQAFLAHFARFVPILCAVKQI